ncbi:MAG: energy transducer TonB [Verrucomicrobia bacterium]|nr:energy transducer TonB [Verrucomicrobiota bacterium]
MISTADTHVPWSPRRQASVSLLIFATQLVLIFLLSDRSPPSVRPVAQVPGLALLTGKRSPLLDLEDPTLFAAPHRESFSGLAWLKPPQTIYHPFEWVGDSQFLSLSAPQLGSFFREFLDTNNLAPTPFEGRPEPVLAPPAGTGIEGAPTLSVMQMGGGLSARQLLNQPVLKSFTNSELLTNSTVQLVVNPAGRPVSITLLSGSGSREADLFALDQARAARFAPTGPQETTGGPGSLASLTWGEMVFEWATLVVPSTNRTNPGTQ